ncbi:ATP-binding protein [Candidatus Dependentiae bacterium]|nr:ATP-binding protein [Candidatus Dependentiae bacterium]
MIKRQLEADIIKGAQYFSVIAILGPRQSGKTTTAQSVFKNHAYVSLEDLYLRTAAKKDPRTFLLANATKSGIIIDEFQHVPELLSYIQTIVDAQQKPGYFILTGSQNFLMNEKISQSLAGRVSIHILLPLSTNELKKSNIALPDIEQMLYNGCYPALYAKNIPADLLYKNYLQTYIERDVRQLAQVGDLTTFQTFISLCAARVGQLLNISSLGNECGVSDSTVKRWISVLEASYVLFLLRPYHNNFGKRLVKSPKMYFYDSGLICYLLRIKKEQLAIHPTRGNIFESFVISDMLKWYHNHGQLPLVYFWRDKAGHEIDCLLQDGNRLVPIEIKSSRTPNNRFFENIEYWQKLTNNKEKNFVVYAGDTTQALSHSDIISWQNMQKIFE